MSEDTKIDVYLICNAKYHDTNFSRLELLKLLAEHEDVWVRVADNYGDVDAINKSRLLITYTCDLCPSVAEQKGLRRFLENGGRWFALHGTNALVEFVGNKADTPDKAPDLMQMLGSRFVAHPAIQDLTIKVVEPEHPLVRGIDDFDVEDEPYYCEHFGDNLVLLESHYDAPSIGYVQSDFGTDRPAQPQMYLHGEGEGEVLYLTLGHCTGKYDMRPLMDVAPVSRCAWNSPVYYELLRRGIRWGIGAL
jgi:type 1 glutamine amidotransferase